MEELVRRVCVPGRSGCGHDAANPCGSLGDVSMRILQSEAPELSVRLCCICWLCLIVCYGCGVSQSPRDAIASRRAIQSLTQLFQMELLTILTVDDQVVVVVVLLAGRCAFLTIW